MEEYEETYSGDDLLDWYGQETPWYAHPLGQYGDPDRDAIGADPDLSRALSYRRVASSPVFLVAVALAGAYGLYRLAGR